MADNAFTLKEALNVYVTKDSLDNGAKSTISARAWLVPPMLSAEMGTANVRKDSRVSKSISYHMYEKAWIWQLKKWEGQLEIFLKEEEEGGIRY